MVKVVVPSLVSCMFALTPRYVQSIERFIGISTLPEPVTLPESAYSFALLAAVSQLPQSLPWYTPKRKYRLPLTRALKFTVRTTFCTMPRALIDPKISPEPDPVPPPPLFRDVVILNVLVLGVTEPLVPQDWPVWKLCVLVKMDVISCTA